MLKKSSRQKVGARELAALMKSYAYLHIHNAELSAFLQ
jgi:hypothetical protein